MQGEVKVTRWPIWSPPLHLSLVCHVVIWRSPQINDDGFAQDIWTVKQVLWPTHTGIIKKETGGGGQTNISFQKQIVCIQHILYAHRDEKINGKSKPGIFSIKGKKMFIYNTFGLLRAAVIILNMYLYHSCKFSVG